MTLDTATITPPSTTGHEFLRRTAEFESALEAWSGAELTGENEPQSRTGVFAGRYEIISLVGRGGMGAVYKVRDQLDGCFRALKIASSNYYKGESGLLQFQQEFLAMAHLQHPNLPAVLDFGTSDTGEPFLVMELIDGRPLRGEGGLELGAFYGIFVQLLRAISFVHERGFLHRDLKPSNILICDGHEQDEAARVVLLDFGLMERIGSPSTKTGLGTPLYLAPEVIKGRVLDPRTDLYALGITAFELLTGRLPFMHLDLRELLALHERGRRPRPSTYNPKVPAALDELIVTLMASSPVERPNSAEDVLLDLSRLTNLVQESDLQSRKAYLRLSELIGREVEMDCLRKGLALAESKRGACHLLSGVAGVGKTRLIEEIQLEALMAGFIVTGASVRQEHRAPYHALRLVLRGLIPFSNENGLMPTAGSVLSSLLPDPLTPIGPMGDSNETVVHAERGRVIEEVWAWASRIAEHRPILILLDDLQWCDESSVLVLRALAERSTEIGIAVVGAFRSEEVSPDSDIGQWTHRSHTEVIEIPAFGEQNLDIFVRGVLGSHRLGSAFMENVFSLTQGNPFFTIELLRHLIDRNALLRRGGEWQLAKEQFELPDSVSRLFMRRLEGLPPLAQRIAGVLSAAGGALPLVDVAAITVSDEKILLDTVELLMQRGITAMRGQQVALVHDTVRETVYAGLEEEERHDFHERLGNLLEIRPSHGSAERAALLGHHFARGRSRLKGLDYLEVAGKAAFSTEQFGAARDLLLEAEELCDQLVEIERRETRRFEIKKMLGLIGVSNDYPMGVRCSDWVIREVMQRGILRPMRILAKFLPHPLPFLLTLAYRLPRRIIMGRRAVDDLTHDVTEILVATAYSCTCLASMSKLTTARRKAAELNAFALGRKCLPVALRRIAETIAANNQNGPHGDVVPYREARDVIEGPAGAAVDDLSRTIGIGACYYIELLAYAWDQDPKFDSCLRRCMEYAGKTDNAFTEHLFLQAEVDHAIHQGNVFAADAAEDKFRSSVRRLGGKASQREWLVDRSMGCLDIACGRFDQAARRISALLAGGSGFFTEGFGSLVSSQLNLQWRKHDQALEDAERALMWARDPEVRSRWFEFATLATMADIHLRQSQPGPALSAVDEMMPYAKENHLTQYHFIEAARRRAEGTSCVNEEAGLPMAREALEMASSLACPKQLAECHVTLANCLRRAGGSVDTQQGHLTQAIEIHKSLGNSWKAEQIVLDLKGSK